MSKLVGVIGEWPENNDHPDGGHLFTEEEFLFHALKLVQGGRTLEEAVEHIAKCLREAEAT